MRARGYEVQPGSFLPKPTGKSGQYTARDLARLENITPERLYKEATYQTPSGEVIPGRRGREMERAAEQKRRRRQREERERQKNIWASIILNEFISRSYDWALPARKAVISWLDKMIAKKGKFATASALQDSAADGVELTRVDSYNRSLVRGFITTLTSYFPRVSERQQDQLLASFESDWPAQGEEETMYEDFVKYR